MGVNMIQADSLRGGPHRWPLLVLHLRAGLMLAGRVGSRLCEGLSPVTESKQGNSNSKLLRQQLCFLFFNLTCTTFVFTFLSSSLLFCSVAAGSLVIGSSLNSIFNLPTGAGESGKSTIVKQMK